MTVKSAGEIRFVVNCSGRGENVRRLNEVAVGFCFVETIRECRPVVWLLRLCWRELGLPRMSNPKKLFLEAGLDAVRENCR